MEQEQELGMEQEQELGMDQKQILDMILSESYLVVHRQVLKPLIYVLVVWVILNLIVLVSKVNR